MATAEVRESTAMERCISLPETLELILLNLPPLTLITTCRLVSRTWKALIETSPSLKYYTSTGLQLHPDPSAPSQDCIFTPLAIDVLHLFWQRLLPLAPQTTNTLTVCDLASDSPLPSPTFSLFSPVSSRSRNASAREIESLYNLFRPFASRIPLLHPSLTYTRHAVSAKNWDPVPMVWDPTDPHPPALVMFPKNPQAQPLLSVMAHLCQNISVLTPGAGSFDFHITGRVPRDPASGVIEAYMLCKAYYTKREGGGGKTDVDACSGFATEGSELLRFDNYPPYRPVVAEKGQNFGYRTLVSS
ncbi:hypothetical protein TWF696_008876 [Orbilia brochopaga]|uniref:F-box domain-containing protein n=1 Tax=Orbilia brochopaga TaxID=3140254 RepID=A0AAV9UGM5_9PEZI